MIYVYFWSGVFSWRDHITGQDPNCNTRCRNRSIDEEEEVEKDQVVIVVQWCNQDFFFKTKTKTLKFLRDQDQAKPSVQDQQHCASQDQYQDQDLFVMYTRCGPKSIFKIFGRKWNFIFMGIFVYGRKKMFFGRPLVYTTKRSWSWYWSWDVKSWSWN